MAFGSHTSSIPFFLYVMTTSTKTVLAGVGLLLIPIPPFATIAGVLVTAAGVGMKVFGKS